MSAQRTRIERATKDDMIASYQSGEPVAALAARHGVPRSTLYAVLRSAGIEPSRSPRTTPLSRGHYCRVCGGPKKIMPSGHRSGLWFVFPTCGDPACTSLLMYVVDTAAKRKSKSRTHPAARSGIDTDIGYDEMREYDDDLDCDDVLERDFQVFCDDDRGADLPVSASSFPWGPLSSISIAVRASANEPAEVGLRLPVPAREAFVERFFGNNPDILGSFDLIYVWRCACPEQAVFSVAAIDDLPSDPGFYGACPRCGAVAVEVVP
jgi:hypothetical protein